MTDPDERIINRAIAYQEGDERAEMWREAARSALHRIFRNTRRLENENESLRADLRNVSFARADQALRAENERLQTHLREVQADNDSLRPLRYENERLRKVVAYGRGDELDRLRAENERLRAAHDCDAMGCLQDEHYRLRPPRSVTTEDFGP
jgi:ribosomal protein S15P/S13E